jgi:hypothetical protein
VQFVQAVLFGSAPGDQVVLVSLPVVLVVALGLVILDLPYEPHQRERELRHFAVIIGAPRRFCRQHDSSASVHTGASLPLLTAVTR